MRGAPWSAQSGNGKKGVKFILAKTTDVHFVPPQDQRNLLGGAIAETNPDNLGRKAKEKAALMKLRVLGNDREHVLPRKVPDDFIRRALQPELADVRRIRKDGSQDCDQVVR
jgi:hypothetical protein